MVVDSYFCFGKGKTSMQPEKSRIRNLSTRYLGFYKYGAMVIILAICSFVLYYFRDTIFAKGSFSSWYFPIYWVYLLYLWWRVNQKVFHVEFDHEFMYVKQKDQDLLIPLENIKDVNLVSFEGVYKVDLYAKEIFGDKFYFKPSLLYPFNHKKKEALVDILWANIEKAKRKKQDFQRNALHS
jgi:hypothetical protein